MENRFLQIIIAILFIIGIQSCCFVGGDESRCIDQDLGTVALKDSFKYLNHPDDDSSFSFKNNNGYIMAFEHIGDTTVKSYGQELLSYTTKKKCYTESCFDIIHTLEQGNVYRSSVPEFDIRYFRSNQVISDLEEYKRTGVFRTTESAGININGTFFLHPYSNKQMRCCRFIDTLTIENKLYTGIYQMWLDSTYYDYSRSDIFIGGIFFNQSHGLIKFYLSSNEIWNRLP